MKRTSAPEEEHPLITIGLPVRNGEAFIRTAIESILRQTCQSFRLVISDNASDDQTSIICAAYSNKDVRIAYVKHSINIGAEANFRFVLDQAKTQYFMWAAADDYWADGFIQDNVEALEDLGPSFIGSISDVVFVKGGALCRKSVAVKALKGPRLLRLQRFLWRPGDNSRFYSVFRTESLRESFPPKGAIYAMDWLIIARLLNKGKFNHVPKPLMFREKARSGKYVQLDFGGWAPLMRSTFPLLPFTREVLKSVGGVISVTLLPALLWLNIIKCAEAIFLGRRKPDSDS